MRPPLHVLRVFCAEDGSGGNGLGVFLDGPAVDEEGRQAIAAELGFAETVFVDDPAGGAVRIFTPATELPFAGHPLVGTAWLLRTEREPVAALQPPAGDVPVRYEDERTFIAGRPEWGPEVDFAPMGSPADVDSLDGPPPGHGAVLVWAWIDEGAGTIRARVFLPDLGIDEDEATGSAALRLCAELGRPIQIRQGRGSLLMARPRNDDLFEVGGLTALDEVRTG